MTDAAFARDYDAATRHAATVRLDAWTTIAIEGRDRATFLHNMCTNDIRSLATGQQCEAFLTDVKGKIVGHVIVFVGETQLLLVTVPGQAETLIAHLDRYIIREDVRLTDKTPQMAWALQIGPQAGHSTSPQPGPTESGAYAAPCVQLWPQATWIAGPSDGSSGPAANDALWHTLRTESGWPLFGVDFDGSHLPQEVGRDAAAISFKKGCYLGQETIARIDALGHVNKRLATVVSAAPLAVGDELMAAETSVGRITTAAWSPQRNAWLGFAMIRRAHNEPGTQLQRGDDPVEVATTPAVARRE